MSTHNADKLITKAEEFDAALEEADDFSEVLDRVAVPMKATRPNLEIRRVNLDLPEWMVRALDRESRRYGVTRQAIMKIILAERLERTPRPRSS